MVYHITSKKLFEEVKLGTLKRVKENCIFLREVEVLFKNKGFYKLPLSSSPLSYCLKVNNSIGITND